MSQSLAARRWSIFRRRKLAVGSGLLLLVLSAFSLTAEIWSNDKPLLLRHEGHWHSPVFSRVEPAHLGHPYTLVTDYRKLELKEGDFAIWPLNRWNPFESNRDALEYPAPPGPANWFGTDDRGRDIFARLLYGFRYSLVFSVAVWAICSLLALVYGGACGFFGGWCDLIGQRCSEILSTIPQLLLLIFLLSVFEPSLTLLVVVSCAFGWISLSYFVRGEVLRVRNLEYVTAARALGATRWEILTKHILPNTLTPVLTFAPFMIVANVTALVALDYMGLGLPAPTPSWGELLQQSQAYFSWAWWVAFFPSFALFLTLLCLALLGEGIRTAFDPNACLPAAEARERWLARLLKGALGKLRTQASPVPAPATVKPMPAPVPLRPAVPAYRTETKAPLRRAR